MRKKHTENMVPNTIYHIYNRGINGTDLFIEDRNYTFFLNKYTQYISPIAETFAYCLLKNHFHFALKIKPKEEIIYFYLNQKGLNNSDLYYVNFETLTFCNKNDGVEKPIPSVEYIINHQFAIFFNSYAQAINKANHRTGALFEEAFRRIPIHNETYLIHLIAYIHKNPQIHGFEKDFREYIHSSYNTYLSTKNTKIKRNDVLEKYGDLTQFIALHHSQKPIENLNKFKIELD